MAWDSSEVRMQIQKKEPEVSEYRFRKCRPTQGYLLQEVCHSVLVITEIGQNRCRTGYFFRR